MTLLFLSPGRGRLLAAALCLAAVSAASASAQSELAVAPGVGTLNEAIAGDASRPADRVYVLTRGGDYSLTAPIVNDGYVLRIRAADGDGVRPVIRPGEGVGSRFLDFGADAVLDGVFVLGVAEDGVQKGIPMRVGGTGQRLILNDCVFEGGNSRFVEVTAPDTKIRVTDSQFRNLVRPDNVSNGRAIDYRDVPADSLFIQNSSFLNVTGFVVRFGTGSASTALQHFIFDHNTVHTTSNDLTDSGVGNRSVEYIVTNNLFVNVNGPGQSPSDTPDGILQVNAFDGSGFSEGDRTIEIANNGLFTSPEILAYYQARADAGDPLIPLQLIQPSSQEFIDGSSQATAQNNITDAVDFVSPPRLDSYIDFLTAMRDFDPNLPFWAFGTDDALYPVEQPLPEDLGYDEAEPAFMAAKRFFPLGDLNWFDDDLKQFFLDGGTVATAGGPETGGGIALHAAYPNPTSGRLTMRLDLDAPAEVTVRVVDLLGRVVLTERAGAMAAGSGQPLRLTVSGLPAGVYLAEVTVRGAVASGSVAQRFTVVR